MAQVGQVVVALESMQEVTRKVRLTEPEDGVKEALVSRAPSMFMSPGEERQQARAELLQVDDIEAYHARKNEVSIFTEASPTGVGCGAAPRSIQAGPSQGPGESEASSIS